MQTKHLFLLPALAFFFCANLHAQVTIGGLENPKGGAILDLNSTAKGGLVLSNVSLEYLDEVPASFPGAATANVTEMKAGLKGAVIYNINSDICTGVHVWNGNFWERVASGTPDSIPGTSLSITSWPANPLGGDIIGFTAVPGAKIYRWYASLDDAPYEYIGLTTTATFSNAFPAGNNKVKVVLDDCQSLKESNEVPFALAALSPNFGSTDGGNIIYIYGDFPYAAASDYAAPENLVAHFDGINNQGLGDKQHSFNADKWVDLKSNFEFPRGDGKGQWLSNGFQVLDNDTAFYAGDFPANFPAGTNPRTIEVIFRTPDAMFTSQLGIDRLIFKYGEDVAGRIFGVAYRGQTSSFVNKPDGCSPENRWIFYAIGGNSANLVTCLSSTPSLETPNTINTVTSTYANRILDEQNTNSYINNVPAEVLVRVGGSLNTQPGPVQIGINLSGATFLSVRLYNRVLTSTEIAKNAELDQKRYLTPPSVTIGGDSCTEVVVLSPHFLMCRVPPSQSGTGAKDVVVNGVTYSGAYTYVGTSDFYVSSISPIVGPLAGGTILTLEGNKLETITKVEVGGISYTNPDTSTSGKYKYTLESHSAGEVDIVITIDDGDEKIYRFAKVFEYQ